MNELLKFKTSWMRVTPPHWYAVFKGDLDGTQYAWGSQYEEILLYRTQTSICTLKRSNFHQKRNTHDIQCQITLKQLRARFARAFLGYFSIYKLKHGFGEVKI